MRCPGRRREELMHKREGKQKQFKFLRSGWMQNWGLDDCLWFISLSLKSLVLYPFHFPLASFSLLLFTPVAWFYRVRLDWNFKCKRFIINKFNDQLVEIQALIKELIIGRSFFWGLASFTGFCLSQNVFPAYEFILSVIIPLFLHWYPWLWWREVGHL